MTPSDPSSSTPTEKPRRFAGARLLFQGIGFLVCLALLGWCLRLALSEENEAAFRQLRAASPGHVLGLLGLSAASIGLNGLIFWVTLRPVRRIELPGMLATNALATLLNYLPFKLSVLSRIAIHIRRDGIDIFTIGAWFAACGVLLLAAPAPLLLTAWLGSTLGAVEFGLACGGTALLAVVILLIAHMFDGERGRLRIASMASPIPLALVLVHTGPFKRLHSGFAMLSSPGAVGSAMALRLTDLLAQSARFLVAASVLEIALPWNAAIPLALAYFMAGVLSPVGALGVREGGVIGLAALLGAGDRESIATLALLVTGTEAIANLACGGIAAGYLRPWQLRTRGTAAENEAATAPPPPPPQQRP